MLKTIRDMLVGAFVCAAVGAAFAATYGTPPTPATGPGLVDGTWLNGIAGGQNRLTINALTAHAGGTQSAAFQIPAGVALVGFATVATTGDSAKLPFALAGSIIMVRNAGAQTLNIYANNATNSATSTTDKINGASNATAYTLAADTSAIFFSARDGAWSAIHGS